MVCLVGNQKDKETEREVITKRAEKFKRDNKISHFVETSALTGDGVNDLIIMSAKMAYLKYEHKIKRAKETRRDSVMRKPKVKKLNNTPKGKKESEDCKCYCM